VTEGHTKLLEVKGLKTVFHTSQGDLPAVGNIDFTLDRGESIGLVGESGCGKTTAALSLMRLLPKEGHILDGQILLDGMDLVGLSEAEMNKHRWKDISIVFQGAMNALNPVLMIGKQIAEAMTLHLGLDEQTALKRAGMLLEQVEIPRGRLSNYPHEFSGGMKQRVMIAMALACDPKIVIGDETTTALDVMVQAQILNLLDDLRKEREMGFILITHDLSVIAEICDRIIVMYAGKIVEEGTADDLFESGVHPYTIKLIDCFPDINDDRKMPEGIEGSPPNMLELPAGCGFRPRCAHATEVCGATEPEVRQISATHRVACHRWKEVLSGK
jgi:peptide/nickel transport system ATP-binding protein